MKISPTQWRSLASLGLALHALCAPNAWACEGPNHQTFSSASALIRSGSFEVAQAQLEGLLSPKFPQPEVLNNLAAVSHLKGNSAKALTWLNQAMALKPTYASIRNNLALLSNKQSANSVPLQLISNLPCEVGQYTAMTLAEGKAYVVPPKNFNIYDADVLSTLALQSDQYPEQYQDESEPEEHEEGLIKAVQLPSLSSAVQAWAAAWRQQSTKDYLRYYASNFNFSDTGARSRSQWERLRTQRLTKYQSIELELSDVNILGLTSDLMQVSFHQRWRANAQTTRESNKTMTWQFQKGHWLILAEHAKDLPW